MIAQACDVGMAEREIADLCVRPLSPVMNTNEFLSWEGVEKETCAKWKQLDSYCDKHLDALRVRLQFLKSLNFLWVPRARTMSSTSGATELQESANAEFSLRLTIFNCLDDTIVGTSLDYLQQIGRCLMKLHAQWKRFHCPDGVLMALFARVYRITTNCKLAELCFYYLLTMNNSKIVERERMSSKLLNQLVAVQRDPVESLDSSA